MTRWASGVDTAWLQLERTDNSVVVHGILWCDGDVDVALLRERVAQRWLPRYPGLRQRPEWQAGELGPVRWVDVEPDLERHVRVEELEAPGDDAALARRVGASMSRALPRDRPWWAMTVLTGYTGGTAILVAMHHGLADGVALNHLFHVLSDDPPGVEDGTPMAYAADPVRLPGQGDRRIVGQVLRTSLSGLAAKVRHAAGTVEGRDELRSTLRAMWTATTLLVNPPVDRGTRLQDPLGVEKLGRWTDSVDLEVVKSAGKAHGATINDVLCAAVAGALRTYLSETEPDRPVPRLRAVVPSNLRPMDRPISERLGNEVGLVLPPLPTDEPDPGTRIERVHRSMATVKRTDQALVTFTGIAVGGYARPKATQGLVRRYAASSSVVITNVPGPVAPLRLAGSRVRDLLFWVPCTGRLALGISILSYDGRVRLGVAGDARVLGGDAGIDRVVAALDDELRRL